VERALGIYEQGGMMRTAVESRILARQPWSGIARATGITTAILKTYEALFFHVRDRLRARSWILLAAVGTLKAGMSEQRRRERAIRLLGYHGGPMILDALFGTRSLQAESNELPGLEWERIAERVELLAMTIAAPLSASAALEVAAIWREIARIPGDDPTAVYGRHTAMCVQRLFSDRIIGVASEAAAPVVPARPRVICKAA
jgi:hypothetical protein